ARHTQCNSRGPAGAADDARLYQKLPIDRPPARPDRHANADLARALGHRDQHDVHDPHAAHDETDQRQEEHQQRHLIADRPGLLLLFLERRNLEIVLLTLADLVPLAQEVLDLRHGLLDLLVTPGRAEHAGRLANAQ